MTVTNPFYNPFLDESFEPYNPNDTVISTIPNTTVYVHHPPEAIRQDRLELFHDTSLTTRNYIPSTAHTTVVNIHPSPRIMIDRSQDNSQSPLIHTEYRN